MVAFRITNHSSYGTAKENFLRYWKNSHFGFDYPCPEHIKPIDAKIVDSFVLEDMPKQKFMITNEFKLVPENEGEKDFFYKDMYSVDLLSYAINKDDCTLFDDDFIRFHKTYYKSKIYKPDSTDLIDIIYSPGDFEFALEPVAMRKKDLEMLKAGQ